MYSGKFVESGHALVEFWIVFHGTAAQRIHPCINTKVHAGKFRIVPDQLWFTDINNIDTVIEQIIRYGVEITVFVNG